MNSAIRNDSSLEKTFRLSSFCTPKFCCSTNASQKKKVVISPVMKDSPQSFMGRSLRGIQLGTESSTTNPLNGDGDLERYNTPDTFSQIFSLWCFSLTPFCSTSAMERQTSSSSSYNLFPKGSILTPTMFPQK